MTTLHDAAESATAGVPVVRGLKWRAYDNGSFWASDTTGLAYQAVAEGWLHRDGRLNHVDGGIEAAKAAAQADFDWRITAAINPDFLSVLDTARAEIEEARLQQKAWADKWDHTQSALTAAQERIAELEGLVGQAEVIFTHCTVSDGMCCCGDNMENHADPMWCGHSPVDHGGYVADGWLSEARATLSPAVKEPK